MSVLDRINQPNDIKYLSETQLEELPGEIRQFLIEHLSKTGGHLASNLGAVELTMALHLVLNFPEDKLNFVLFVANLTKAPLPSGINA